MNGNLKDNIERSLVQEIRKNGDKLVKKVSQTKALDLEKAAYSIGRIRVGQRW